MPEPVTGPAPLGLPARLARAWRLRRARARRLALCTVATEGFLPGALVLFEALARHHPGTERVLLYVREEEEAGRVPRIPGVRVLAVEDLVDATLEAELRRRYRIAELCFALKPRLLRHCLALPAERALYLDSDLDVRSALEEALLALEGSAIVLTPHLDAPIPRDGKLPSEITISRAGACNAGFIGIAQAGQAEAFLAWWDSRVTHWGFVAPEFGYQGDQKWLDLAPSLFPGARLLRDPGSNVGSWNLHSRRVAREPGGAFTVNGVPLAFFHFSGFDPATPGILSRYQNRTRLAEQPAIADLAADYARRLLAAGDAARALAWDERPAPAAAPSGGTYREGPLLDVEYRAGYEVEIPEQPYESGEEIVARVKVTNVSGSAWPVGKSPEGRGGIALSWHLRNPEDGLLLWENRRYYLPADLAPGESVEMVIGIRAPDVPSRYILQFDLVHEEHTWFSVQGSDTARVPIRVGLFDDPA